MSTDRSLQAEARSCHRAAALSSFPGSLSVLSPARCVIFFSVFFFFFLFFLVLGHTCPPAPGIKSFLFFPFFPAGCPGSRRQKEHLVCISLLSFSLCLSLFLSLFHHRHSRSLSLSLLPSLPPIAYTARRTIFAHRALWKWGDACECTSAETHLRDGQPLPLNGKLSGGCRRPSRNSDPDT